MANKLQNNKNIIIILLVLVVVITIAIVVFTRKNVKYVDKAKTIEEIIIMGQDIKQNKVIYSKYFEDYELKSSNKTGDITTNIYNLNDKYELEVKYVNNIVISAYLVNKITYSSVDIINGSLEEYLEID